nr:putative matrix protein [Guangdong tick quaranjavirus]
MSSCAQTKVPDINDLITGVSKISIGDIAIPPEAWLNSRKIENYLKHCQVNERSTRLLTVAVGVSTRKKGLGLLKALEGDELAKWLALNYKYGPLAVRAKGVVERAAIVPPTEVDLNLAVATRLLNNTKLGTDELRRAVCNNLISAIENLHISGK